MVGSTEPGDVDIVLIPIGVFGIGDLSRVKFFEVDLAYSVPAAPSLLLMGVGLFGFSLVARRELGRGHPDGRRRAAER